MKALTFIGCSVIAAACASNKPAEEPTQTAQNDRLDESTTTMESASKPDLRSEPQTGSAAQSTTDPSTAADAPAPRATAAEPMQPPGARELTPPGTAPAAPEAASRPDADNTRVNKRDQGGSLTPMDQGNGAVDLKITKQIRQAVMADGSLSFTAKNVKIITSNGKVTLRGPVKTDEERSAIDTEARKVAGEANVDNQIEVKK